MEQQSMCAEGKYMYNLAADLFPICRSIMGEGTRKTLYRLQQELPQLKLYQVPSGTRVFDWTIPKEWNIEDAYIEDGNGNKIIDFKKNNLHVVGYSSPIDKIITFEDLQSHLYSLPEQPDWIPYVTSYYKEHWGFCMSHSQRKNLPLGNYHVVIKSKLEDGYLTYGELLIPGKSKKEIFLSSYICHPSMANNELSGPVLLVKLAQWLLEKKDRYYSYRLILVPETIGSITYLSLNLPYMKENIIAGYNITCVGDDKQVSYVPTRNGNTLSDRAALNILNNYVPNFISYTFLQRGSDERQYNAPGIDLPVCTICRSKYHEYPEYHTSADNMSFISVEGLQGSFDLYTKIISAIEENRLYNYNCLCEPQLGKRGLYPTESFKGSTNMVKGMMDFLAYTDGTHDLIEISDIIQVPIMLLVEIAKKLLKVGLVSIVEED